MTATALTAVEPEPAPGLVLDEDTKIYLPAPPPEAVREARAFLTPRYAAGVDAFLWDTIQHPLPDLDAIDAVIAASDRAQQGVGEQPQPMEVAAALVVLGAALLDMDQTEARLLNTAQASGVSWLQMAAILDLTVEEIEERYRQLKPRLDEPVAEVLPPRSAGAPAQGRQAADLPPVI